jgi:hypothetical protein
MELLLIPFLLVAGTSLIFVGVHGVPAAPWLRASAADETQTKTAAAAQASSGARHRHADAASLLTARRRLLRNVRHARHWAPGRAQSESAAADSAAETRWQDGVQAARAWLADPSPAESTEDHDGDEVPDGEQPRNAGAESFTESDAMLGQLLTEMSEVRSELNDLRDRIERLNPRQPALTRAPGGPRRRRLRRIGGF